MHKLAVYHDARECLRAFLAISFTELESSFLTKRVKWIYIIRGSNVRRTIKGN